MKKLCYTAFVAFWASIATLLTLYCLADNKTSSAASDIMTYSLAEVRQHAARDNCWMAIEGKVYDLTAYLPMHPAGPDIMLNWCGTEATMGMRTKGIGSDHSSFAWRQLENYLIGNFKGN